MAFDFDLDCLDCLIVCITSSICLDSLHCLYLLIAQSGYAVLSSLVFVRTAYCTSLDSSYCFNGL